MMSATLHHLPRRKARSTPKPAPVATHMVLSSETKWRFTYLASLMKEVERVMAGPSAPIASVKAADKKLAVVLATLPDVRAAMAEEGGK